MSRPARFAWIAGWVVALGFVSVVSAHAQAAHPTPEESAGPPPEPTPAANPATARCEEYIAVLSGKKKDDAMLKDPKVKAIVARSFDLVACRAVAADSDEPCALVPDQKDECRLLRGVYHELRTNPQGRAFTFPDVKYEMCKSDRKLAPVCDRLRDAARSGDPNECAGTGSQETDCRAAITLDESRCAKAEDPHGCRKGIEFNRVFAKGLQALAESGPEREQALAKAALGDADACTKFAQAALGFCAEVIATSTSSPAAKTSPAPAKSRSAPAQP